MTDRFVTPRSKSRSRANASLCAAMVLLCGAAASARPESVARFGRDGTFKVRVPGADLPAGFLGAAGSGASLVAQYESFAVVEVPAIAAGRIAANMEAEVLADENSILLNAGALNTSRPEVRALQRPRPEFKGRAMHMVQFASAVQPAWYEQMVKTGVEVVTYIPSNAYLVYGDAEQIRALQGMAAAFPQVQWDGPYLDEYRIDPTVALAMRDAAVNTDRTRQFSVQLVRDPKANGATLDVINAIKSGPITGECDALGYHNLVVAIPPIALSILAKQQDVVSIQPYLTPEKFDERQDMIVAGSLSGNVPVLGAGYMSFLASKGFTQAQFTASGFSVDVTDSGIDNATTSPNHFGLYLSGIRPGASRIIYNRLIGTAHGGSTLQGCDGHGNLNTHIVLGWDTSVGFPFTDASGYHYGLGVCPFTQAGSSVIFDPNTYTSPNFETLQSMAYNNGARISTNSWGANTGGIYNSDSQRYDALVRDAQPTGSTNPAAGNQEMVIVFAAGNAGSGASSVGTPGTGKNLITVGAGENVQAMGGSDQCGWADSTADNANQVISFSSRGPCTDTRKKPDICAPGTHVSGGVAQTASPATTGTANVCFNASGVCGGVGNNFFPAGQQFYTTSTGTSHSTPCVAGGAALVRQFFINQGMSPATPAMTKAVMMNSARYMTGVADTLWSNTQGMGELNLADLFDRGTATPTIFRDEVADDILTAAGQTRVFSGSIGNNAKPFRVTLAWTDAPGATSGAASKNDLNLTVTIGANTFKGNVFSGANSITGGSADSRNNVESVFLPAGTTGSYTVTVTAANINSDGVPNSGTALDQDFALVIYNGSAAACYANCDGSTVAPILNANDFTCFLNAYAASQSYANCDGSTVVPVLNANDFTCFLNAYSVGCP